MLNKIKIFEERGSYIISATMILPIFIFIVIGLILVAVHFSSVTFDEINANEFLIYKEGSMRNTRNMTYEKRKFDCYKSSSLIAPYLSINLNTKRNFIGVNTELSSNIVIRRYSVKEKKILMFKGIIDEATE